MTRDELVLELERQAEEAESMQSTAPVHAVLRNLLPKLRELQVEPNGNGKQPKADRMIKAEEVAERMGMSVRWIYEHSGELPFTKKYPSGAVRFSELGLERWLSRQR